MLINAFDPQPGRTLELHAGDLFEQGFQLDVLVISAREGFYEPEAGSMVAVLENMCGITVGQLPRELDFSDSSLLKAWITPDLETLPDPPQWPAHSLTRFRRLAVVETAPDVIQQADECPVFQQLYSFLALLPLYGINAHTVACPLLNTGRQQADPSQVYPALIRGVRENFRHLPELNRLLIFDLREQDLRLLGQEIDRALDRPAVQSHFLKLNHEEFPQVRDVIESLRAFLLQHRDIQNAPQIKADAGLILKELTGESLTLVAVGVAARRLIESLLNLRMQQLEISLQLDGSNRDLFQKLNRMRYRINSWSLSALHTVRSFGNWMAHCEDEQLAEDDDKISASHVKINDMLSMLLALQRVVDDYPWRSQRSIPRRVKTPKPLQSL
jgi:hypothetical protein